MKQNTVRLLLETGLVAEACIAAASGPELKKGAKVTCCVLDVSVERGCLVVSLNPRLTGNETPVVVTNSRSSKKSRKIEQQMVRMLHDAVGDFMVFPNLALSVSSLPLSLSPLPS